MFISIPVLVCIFFVLAWYYESDADKLIEEMRDPGGLKRQALIDSARADKAARKAARGPAGAIIGGIITLGALVGIIGLVWGGFTLACIACGIVVTIVLTGVALAVHKISELNCFNTLVLTISGLVCVPLVIGGVQCLIAVLSN